MQIDHFRQLAAYNLWANARLSGAALEMPEAAYRHPTGVFLGSLHATLNHLLAADRIRLKRIAGTGEAPNRVEAILFDDRAALTRARLAEEGRVVAVIEAHDTRLPRRASAIMPPRRGR